MEAPAKAPNLPVHRTEFCKLYCALSKPSASAHQSISVEELHDQSAILALTPAWERLRAKLAARGGPRGPFLSPTWSAVFAAELVRDARRLRILIARREGEVAGILPLLAEQRNLAGVPARILRSLSDDHSQRCDAPVDGEEPARALVEHLLPDRSWDLLELREGAADPIPSGFDALEAAAQERGLPTARWPSLRSPYLPLPASPEVLDASLAPKLRGNLRRRERKLATDVGPVELEPLIGELHRDVIDRALTDGFRLEASGWKGDQGTAIACDRVLQDRYRALAHAFSARGQLALYFLTVGGERRAFHFGLIEDDVYYVLKPGFDPALSAYGPGHLLVHAVARDLIERGVRELDFLGDDAPWKQAWTHRVRAHAWRCVFCPTLRGRTLHAWKFRTIPWLKQHLERR
jgi:CelD/BcsL family acetyltransferase involved in cellulose biosynthesis